MFRVNNKQKEEKKHGIKAVWRGDVSTFTHFIIIKSSLHRKGRKGLVEKVESKRTAHLTNSCLLWESWSVLAAQLLSSPSASALSLLIEKETRTAVVERGRGRGRERGQEREGEVEGKRHSISVCVREMTVWLVRLASWSLPPWLTLWMNNWLWDSKLEDRDWKWDWDREREKSLCMFD